MTTPKKIQSSNPAALVPMGRHSLQTDKVRGGFSALDILIGLQQRYADKAGECAEKSLWGPKRERDFYARQSSKYNKLFIGITNKILWLMKN